MGTGSKGLSVCGLRSELSTAAAPVGLPDVGSVTGWRDGAIGQPASRCGFTHIAAHPLLAEAHSWSLFPQLRIFLPFWTCVPLASEGLSASVSFL